MESQVVALGAAEALGIAEALVKIRSALVETLPSNASPLPFKALCGHFDAGNKNLARPRKRTPVIEKDPWGILRAPGTSQGPPRGPHEFMLKIESLQLTFLLSILVIKPLELNIKQKM